MEDYQQRWSRCLQLIRENLTKDVKTIPSDDTEWVYKTWFTPITFESYEPATTLLVLCVPNRYVCEYIEHYRLAIWKWALHSTFGKDVRLSYHITQPAANHSDGYISDVSPERPRFAVPDARKELEDGLRRVVGDGMQWNHAYDNIASWLQDNQGRGLLVVGTPGVGKSVICCDVLPLIIGGQNWRQHIAVVRAEDLRSRLDELKRKRCVVIDDLGKDKRKFYGETDNSFLNLCEASAQGGPLLIINTNLSTTTIPKHFQTAALYPDSIQNRYGMEVLDRLKAVTAMVRIEGESLRASRGAATLA